MLPVGAAAAVLISLGAALVGYADVRASKNEVARLAALVLEKDSALASARQGVGAAMAVPVPQLSEAEWRGLSRLWNEVAEGAGSSQPWVLMANNEGQFGYLSATAQTGAPRLLLVRCLLTTSDPAGAETLCLLVPAREDLHLSLPEIGRLGGQSISCDVTTADNRTTVGLTLGTDFSKAIGIRGRVGTGSKPVEIGELRTSGGLLRVTVQDVTVGEKIG
jgi:hypothetical protein